MRRSRFAVGTQLPSPSSRSRRRPCRCWRGLPRWSRCSTPRSDRRLARWLGSSRCPLVSNAIYPLLYADGELGGYWGTIALCVLVMTVAIGWGLFARTRRELVASLHERARRLESEQLLRVEQARDAERRRIAREMHDVLAHRLSLLSLHAGALEFRRDASPEEVAEAAGVIRASGQAALEELRAVIGLLREQDERCRAWRRHSRRWRRSRTSSTSRGRRGWMCAGRSVPQRTSFRLLLDALPSVSFRRL